MTYTTPYFTSVDDLEPQDYLRLFTEIKIIKDTLHHNPRAYEDIAAGMMLGMMFYEPSTRTSGSFNKAFQKLGGRIYEFHTTTSSIAKGESFDDTARMVAMETDMMVVRCGDAGTTKHLAENILSIPVINAGEGTGEHPTQALLDMYTIWEEFGRCDVHIGLAGDLARGRTTHSLIKLASKLGATVTCIAPDETLAMPDSYIQTAKQNGAVIHHNQNLDNAIKNLNVLYMTRLQTERTHDQVHHRFNEKISGYQISNTQLNQMPEQSIVMHPLPRLDELPAECDKNPRARYFQQAENGIYARMALMKHMILKL